MYKNNVYTFSYEDWKYGMKPSPYSGVSDMRNIDPFSKVGALLCGKKPTSYTDGMVAGLAHATYNENDDKVYMGTQGTGRLVSMNHESGTFTSISTSADECQGLNIWQNHVIYAGELKLEVYDIDGTFFYNNWKAFTEGNRGVINLPHHVLVGRDDVVYITDGIYIASLQMQDPDVPFDPSNAATYTWNPTALDLPKGYVASSLSEYGQYLIIGTYFNEVLNRGNRADIFPWDKINQSFSNPIRSRGNGVWQSIEHNGRLFALFDKKSQKIVQTNLSVYELMEELKLNSDDKMMHPDGITTVDEEILFGIGTRSPSTASCGVYGYKAANGLNGEYAAHLKSVLSVGDTGVEIGSVVALTEGKYLATWSYNNGVTETYGVDVFGDEVVDDYSAYVVSPYTVIAREGSKKQFKTIEINLGKKLATGQAVRVSYRANRDDTFTTIKTFSYTTHGAVSALTEGVDGISPVTGMEIKVELKGSGTTSPEFLSLNLI